MHSEPEKSFNFWTETEKEALAVNFPIRWRKIKIGLSLFALLLSLYFMANHFVFTPKTLLQKAQNEVTMYEEKLASLELETRWQEIQKCQEINEAKQNPDFAKKVAKDWQACEKSLSAFYKDPNYNQNLQKANASHKKFEKDADYKFAFFAEDASSFWQKSTKKVAKMPSPDLQWLQIMEALKQADPLQNTEVEANLNLESWTFDGATWTLQGRVNEVAEDPLLRLESFQKALSDVDSFTQVSMKDYDKKSTKFSFEISL